MLEFILGLCAYLILLNLITVGLFKLDKRKSETGAWRIPEKTLLAFAILGGSIGAKWAQHRFRHKTRKQPFATLLNGICILQALLILCLCIPATRALLLS